MKTLTTHRRCLAVLAFPTLLVASGCDKETLPGSPGDDEDRAFALANEIVTGLVSSYAARHHGGQSRAYALDLSSFYGPPAFGGGSRYPAPALEEGLRRVAETLSPERASWIVLLHPLRADKYTDGVFTIHAQVVDLHAEHCCAMEAVALAGNEDGWEVKEFFHGGHVEESNEYRRDRLARGRKGPAMRVLRGVASGSAAR